jgi:hypothetical protein
LAEIFTKLEISHRARGGTIIAWELHPAFVSQYDMPFTFTVSVSRSSNPSDFTDVITVVDDYAIDDPNQHIFGKNTRLFYKVTVITADGFEAESRVKQAVCNLNGRDRALLGEMIRKEQVRMSYAGECGYLYKRRYFGETCTQCTDYDTGEVTDSKCLECFGTGFVGGYFPPVHYDLIESNASGGHTRRKQTMDNRGPTENQVHLHRGLNCPWLDTGDVWLDPDSDQRFIVQAVTNHYYRGCPWLFDPIELRLAPITDIIYALERPDDTPGST